MRFFLIISCFIIANALPQGYNYNAPSGGLVNGIASGISGGGNIGTNLIGGGSGTHSTINSINSHSIGQSGIGLGVGGLNTLGASSFGAHGVTHGNTHGASFVAHGQQGPIVSKHFYLHSAPEEHEDIHQQKTLNAGPSRKNYNIVFIKAPHQSSKAAALSIAQAHNEEKTIIYVLSKKTDASDIQAHIKEAPQILSKPEVFFIKYKTPEEAAHAQRTIQAQFDSLGGTSQFSDEGFAPVQSVIGSIGGSSSASFQSDGTAIGVSGDSINHNQYLPPHH